MRTALTIAGSDPGGGAGIQADLKVFAAHGVFGLSAITALTVQNTLGVTRVVATDAAVVAEQIDAVVTDFGASATKIGMLPNAATARAVADAIQRHRLTGVVADPVFASSDGHPLFDAGAIEIFREALMPAVTIITPNISEAMVLSGLEIHDVAGAHAAARALVKMGARAVLIKGGHLDAGADAVDVLFDGDTASELSAPRHSGRHTHGTGCALSSAVAARLAAGRPLADAVRDAKAYVTRAIADAPRLGHGRGPLQHFPGGRLLY